MSQHKIFLFFLLDLFLHCVVATNAQLQKNLFEVTTKPFLKGNTYTISRETQQTNNLLVQIDFSKNGDPNNTPFRLYNGAKIIHGPLISKALRIDRDGPLAYVRTGTSDISPSNYPDLTMMASVYIVKIANSRGWIFGHEYSGYDRTILMHDDRFGGGIASAVGKTWNPGDNMKTPVGEWIHVAAVFRQNGESYVFLNGERSENTVIAQNDYGLSSLWIGRPHHAGHWTDCWIKEVKVFGRALSDEDVKVLSEMFFEDEAFNPLKCPDGSVEIGQVAHGLSSPNDIGGCGLENCDARYNKNSIEECKNHCLKNERCKSFSWAPENGDRHHLSRNVCAIYDSNIPDQEWGPRQIMCEPELTGAPSSLPSEFPSQQPTPKPSASPSAYPSETPTQKPTPLPSVSPTAYPSEIPTIEPSGIPSEQPSTSANPSKSNFVIATTKAQMELETSSVKEDAVKDTAEQSLIISIQSTTDTKIDVDITSTKCDGFLCVIDFTLSSMFECKESCTSDAIAAIESSFAQFSGDTLSAVTDDGSLMENFKTYAEGAGYDSLTDVSGFRFNYEFDYTPTNNSPIDGFVTFFNVGGFPTPSFSLIWVAIVAVCGTLLSTLLGGGVTLLLLIAGIWSLVG